MRKRMFDALQRCDLGAHLIQVFAGDRANRAAVLAILQFEQRGDFVERESELLGALDETNAMTNVGE